MGKIRVLGEEEKFSSPRKILRSRQESINGQEVLQSTKYVIAGVRDREKMTKKEFCFASAPLR